MCTSCESSKALSTGNYELQYVTYYGYDVEENYPEELKVFDRLKYELKRITEEEYEEANGQNVFIDVYSNGKSQKIYLYLELYLYYTGSDEFEKIESENIKLFYPDMRYDYSGECTFKINNEDYAGIVYLCFKPGGYSSGTQEISIKFTKEEYVMKFSDKEELRS